MKLIFEQRPKQVQEGALQICGTKANGKVLLMERAGSLRAIRIRAGD